MMVAEGEGPFIAMVRPWSDDRVVAGLRNAVA
jgi:hypothetical protein